jgi:protein-L-isoaspartate(D-aspartate) O-methyltransferase
MDIEAAREQMIEQQVRAWEVLDLRILSTLRSLPRELFVPELYRDLAFADTAIPLPDGQQMLTPKVEGKILQALNLGPEDHVLEIGGGSGYLAACLAGLAARVRVLEIFPDIAERASANLRLAAVNNAVVETADGMQFTADSEFDAIAVTGSLPMWDERWQSALKIGGRMFVVVGTAPIMEAWRITRVAEREWQRESLFETVLPALINAPPPPAFVF